MYVSIEFYISLLMELIFLVLMGRRAWQEGFWSNSNDQKQRRAKEVMPDELVAVVSQHIGYWMSYPAAVVVAFLIDRYGKDWAAAEVVVCGFATASFISLYPLSTWAQATEPGRFSEGFARHKLTSIPGVMLGMFITFVATVILLYLGFAHYGSPREVWDVTIGIGVISGLGTILPYLLTFGRLRKYDLQLTGAIWAGLLVLALLRLYA